MKLLLMTSWIGVLVVSYYGGIVLLRKTKLL